jgi:hypothetical protein
MNLTAPLIADIALAAFIIIFVKWNSFQFNYTEKATSFLYFCLQLLRIAHGVFPFQYIGVPAELVRLYTEQFIVCSYLHRIIPPWAFILCEILSIVSNIFIAIILAMYLSFSVLEMPGFFHMLIDFYAFMIFLNGCFAVFWHLYDMFSGKKTKVRHVTNYHIEKRTRNLKMLVFYICVDVSGLFWSESLPSSNPYRRAWTVLDGYGFQVVTLVILAYERHRRLEAIPVPVGAPALIR